MHGNYTIKQKLQKKQIKTVLSKNHLKMTLNNTTFNNTKVIE